MEGIYKYRARLFYNRKSIEKHEKYIGKRIKRGLFRTLKGLKINADVNGAYSIMKKAFPNAISVDRIETFGLMPRIIQQNIADNIICNKMSTV